MCRTLPSPPPPPPILDLSFLPCIPSLLPQSGCHMCITAIYVIGMGSEISTFFTRIKWMGFLSKTMGKNHKNLSRNLKQIRVKLHGGNEKLFEVMGLDIVS